jgi:hypothetical protein
LSAAKQNSDFTPTRHIGGGGSRDDDTHKSMKLIAIIDTTGNKMCGEKKWYV